MFQLLLRMKCEVKWQVAYLQTFSHFNSLSLYSANRLTKSGEFGVLILIRLFLEQLLVVTLIKNSGTKHRFCAEW
jgi:hypothetical protein